MSRNIRQNLIYLVLMAGITIIIAIRYHKPAMVDQFIDRKIVVGANTYSLQSQTSFAETLAHLEAELRNKQIPIFAKFDHAKNAKQAGLELRPTTVIVFGSPKVGTLLMQTDQSIALALPLKMLIWEDADGHVWITFPKLQTIVTHPSKQVESILTKLQILLQTLATTAATPTPTSIMN